MLEYFDGVLELTKGDTINLTIELQNAQGEPYVMLPTDRLIFDYRKDYFSRDSLSFASSTNEIHISHTQSLDFQVGMGYFTITLESINGHYTVIGGDNDEPNIRVWKGVDNGEY